MADDVTTLSLITATYNSVGTIYDTMRSIAAQTRKPFEHLVMDGGSTDATLDIVRREGTPGLIVSSERDNGFYDACNKGIARAKGDVIGFLNSDDFYAHDRVIEAVLDEFADPTIDGVYADLVYVDQQDTDRAKRLWRSHAPSAASLRQGRIPAHPTVYLRRAVYERIGGFDLAYRLAADYEFLLRVFAPGELRTVHISDVWVRMRTGGATGGSIAEIKRQNDEILAARHAHGLHYPRPFFFARKAADRVAQRLRGRLTSLATPEWRR